jgi:anti-sigma regulatory factor (Ser/Thr protein kinase)
MDVGAVAVRHDPASAALVRQAIARDLESQAVSRDSIDDVVLVASELVGNAVVHTTVADADLDIGWQVDGRTVTIWVCDPSLDKPRPRAAEPLATSGRGLAIVAAVASDWGVEPLPTGKRVWARVAVSAAA